MGTGKYVSRKRTTCATCCESYTSKAGKPRKKEVDFIPVDPDLRFVYARNLSKKSRSDEADKVKMPGRTLDSS